MNRQEIIAMAREAGFLPNSLTERSWLERFAALVAAKERERLASDVELPKPIERDDTEHAVNYCTIDQARDYGVRCAAAAIESCNRESNAAWKLMCEKMVKAERDACAITAVIHSQYPVTTEYDRGFDAGSKRAADAIRARGQP